MPPFRLHTLGELSLQSLRDPLSRDGDHEVVGASKGLAILALLAATPGHGARRSYLGDLLWPEAPPTRRRGSLRQALWYLKRRAGTELLHRTGDRLSLREDRIRVDLWELERAAERERWAEVVRLGGGPFVPGVPGTVSDEFRCRVRSVRSRVSARVETAQGMLPDDPVPERAGAGGAGPGFGGRADADDRLGAARHELEPSHRHDWVTLLAPATVAAAGLALAALLV